MIEESPTKIITSFSAETMFEDLPGEVVHETKRILLDSFGCALASPLTDRGKIAIKYARCLGGPSEASILYAGDKVSCLSASFANGEMITALDYDCRGGAMHTPPFVIPAPLAMAEREKASGKDLILAVALALEVGSRICLSLPLLTTYGHDPWRPYSHNTTVFGATAGACKILGFDQEKTANAFGITCQMIPVPSAAKFHYSGHPVAMYKYGLAGWTAQAGVAATLLTELGFLGDTTILDGEQGYWKMYGAEQCKWDTITEGLGKKWYLMNADYKAYPCCGGFAPNVEALMNIVQENNLMPDEIEKIIVKGGPLVGGAIYKNKVIRSAQDAQFSIPYVIAVAAHMLKPIDWQDPVTMRDPKILKFMDKVTTEVDIKLESLGVCAYVEVVARGKTFKKEFKATVYKGFLKGRRGGGLEMIDEDLKEKFRANTSKTLQTNKTEKAIDTIYNLEKVDDVTNLTKLLSV